MCVCVEWDLNPSVLHRLSALSLAYVLCTCMCTYSGGKGRSVKGTSSAYKSSDQFNTTELHAFITDTFPGATLLEEHQVPYV